VACIIRSATHSDVPGICHLYRNDPCPWTYLDECNAWVTKRLERGFFVRVTELA